MFVLRMIKLEQVAQRGCGVPILRDNSEAPRTQCWATCCSSFSTIPRGALQPLLVCGSGERTAGKTLLSLAIKPHFGQSEGQWSSNCKKRDGDGRLSYPKAQTEVLINIMGKNKKELPRKAILKRTLGKDWDLSIRYLWHSLFLNFTIFISIKQMF